MLKVHSFIHWSTVNTLSWSRSQQIWSWEHLDLMHCSQLMIFDSQNLPGALFFLVTGTYHDDLFGYPMVCQERLFYANITFVFGWIFWFVERSSTEHENLWTRTFNKKHMSFFCLFVFRFAAVNACAMNAALPAVTCQDKVLLVSFFSLLSLYLLTSEWRSFTHTLNQCFLFFFSFCLQYIGYSMQANQIATEAKVALIVIRLSVKVSLGEMDPGLM